MTTDCKRHRWNCTKQNKKTHLWALYKFISFNSGHIVVNIMNVVPCDYLFMTARVCVQLSQVQPLRWAVRSLLVALVGGISRLAGQSCLHTLRWAAASAGARPPLLLPRRHALAGLHLPQPRDTHQYNLPPQVHARPHSAPLRAWTFWAFDGDRKIAFTCLVIMKPAARRFPHWAVMWCRGSIPKVQCTL